MSTGRLLKDEIIFGGGLDTDSDEKFVSQGDYVDALNMVRVEDGSNGVMVNIKGNSSVYANTSGYVEYLCGWVYYEKNESVILFIYRLDGGSDSGVILEFNPQTESVEEIFNDGSGTILSFQNPLTTDYFIKADILDDWLAFTDNVGRVKMFNIDNVKNGVYAATPEYFDVCKMPPVHVPTFSFGTDSSLVFNNLTSAYQFKYRYVYNDYRYSVFSEASDLAINDILVRVSEDVVFGNDRNFIYVKFNSGANEVRFVDIAVRDGNVGAWGRVVRIDKTNDNPENVYALSGSTYTLMSTSLSGNTYYYYRFYNNEGRIALGAEPNRQYDVVPDTSETLSFVDNRLVLGGNVAGKDLVELDVGTSVNYNNPGIFESWGVKTPVDWGGNYINVTFDADSLVGAGGRAVWYPGDNVYFNFQITFSTAGSNVVISSQQYVIITELLESVDEFITFLGTNAVDADVSGATVSTNEVQYSTVNNTVTFRATFGTSILTGLTSVDIDASIVKNVAYDYTGGSTNYVNDLRFKRGEVHKLGVVYQDKYGVKSPVLTSTGTSVRVQDYTSAVGAGGASISYTFVSSPPSWATTYRWVYAYRPRSFVQTLITDVSYFENADGVLNTAKLALDVSGYSLLDYPNYTFEVGDYIKVLKEGGSYSPGGTFTDNHVVVKVEDVVYSINDGSSDLAGIWLIVSPINLDGYTYDDASTAVNSSFLNALVEIYKPVQELQDEVYYEIGGGGYIQSGEHKDWATGSDSGTINAGDVWCRPIVRAKRTGSAKNAVTYSMIYAEDPYPYEGAPRKDVGIGDVNQELDDSRNKYENTLIYSRKYFQDTQINGLSTFDFVSKKDVSDVYGKIKGLEVLGNVLVIISESKVFTSYIGATEYLDAGGDVNVIKSTEPIGYIRPHADNYGTFLKESIINTGKYVYFFDIFNGCVVRKSYNGLYPISGDVQTESGLYRYKMRGFFKNLSETLLAHIFTDSSVSYEQYYNVKVFMGYDPYYHNVYITFADYAATDNNVSLIFNETSNRWVSKFGASVLVVKDYVSATMYPFTKNKIYSWHNNILYRLNSDAVSRCNLYGEQQDSEIKFVSHLSPNVIKIFNSIAIHSDDNWSNEYIQISPSTSYPNGMYTKVLDSEWIYEEGVQKYEIPKNMKTRTSVINNYDRINGEDMRGNVIEVKLTNDSKDKVELFKVDVISELSK